MISYLGKKLFELKDKEKTGLKLVGVTCPELWLWMFETSGVFNGDEMEKMNKNAVYYAQDKKNRHLSYRPLFSSFCIF